MFLVQLKFNVSRFKKTHENCHLLGKFRVSRYTRARYLSLSARLSTLFAASFSVFLDLHLGIYLTPRASLSARFIPIPRDSLCPTSLSPFQRPSLSVCLVARLLFPLPCFLLPPLFPSVARIRARFPFRCFVGCFARSSLGPVPVFQPVSPVHWSFYFLVQSVLVTLCPARSDTPYANDHTAYILFCKFVSTLRVVAPWVSLEKELRTFTKEFSMQSRVSTFCTILLRVKPVIALVFLVFTDY